MDAVVEDSGGGGGGENDADEVKNVYSLYGDLLKKAAEENGDLPFLIGRSAVPLTASSALAKPLLSPAHYVELTYAEVYHISSSVAKYLRTYFECTDREPIGIAEKSFLLTVELAHIIDRVANPTLIYFISHGSQGLCRQTVWNMSRSFSPMLWLGMFPIPQFILITFSLYFYLRNRQKNMANRTLLSILLPDWRIGVAPRVLLTSSLHLRSQTLSTTFDVASCSSRSPRFPSSKRFEMS